LNIYYHDYPTCPVCHEPHGYNYELTEYEDGFCCEHCKAFFRINILFEKEKLGATVKLLEAMGQNPEKALLSSGLIWHLEFNNIEKSYLDWINKAPTGAYLVTWPWDNVRFSTILAVEYLMCNQKKKVAIISGGEYNKIEGKINIPDHADIMNHLFIRKKKESPYFTEEIQKEMRSLNRSWVLKKNDFVKYTTKSSEKGTILEEGVYNDSMDNSLARLRTSYGSRIRSVVRHPEPRYEKKPPRTYKNGDVDIILCYRPNQYFLDNEYLKNKNLTRDINYKSDWLWDFILKRKEYERVSEFIPLNKLENGEKKTEYSSGLYLIPSSENIENIKNTVESISPDLLIVEDSDHYHRMRKISWDGSALYKKFDQMIKGLDNSVILMFSCDPEARHSYNIADNLNKSYPLGYHTWDSRIILEKLNEDSDNKVFYTLGSSGKIKTRIKPELKVEYEIVEELDKVVLFENECRRVLPKDANLKSLISYIQRIKRCILDIYGDTREITTLRDVEINYDLVLNRIRKHASEEDYKKISSILSTVYKDSMQNPRNPLREKIEGIIKNILYKKDTFVTLAVDGRDIQGAKILFSQFEDCSRFRVCSWSFLEKTRTSVPREYVHHIIATSPYANHKFSQENDPRTIFHFVGERKNIEKFKSILHKRTDDSQIFPIFGELEDGQAPKILQTITEDLGITNPEKIQNTSFPQEEEDNHEEEEYSGGEVEYFIEKKIHFTHPNPEEEAKNNEINTESPFLKESKNILSNARYNYKDNEIERHKAIVRAIISCGDEKKVLQALQYKSNIWGENNYDLDNACTQDIAWLKKNWDTELNIKEKLTNKGIKLKEESIDKN